MSTSTYFLMDGAHRKVDELFTLAEDGNNNALHAINHLSVLMAKRLGSLGKESMFSETCIVIPADQIERNHTLDKAKELHVGSCVGYPRSNPKGRPRDSKATPAVIWNHLQVFIENVQQALLGGATFECLYNEPCPLPYKLSEELVSSIAELPKFGGQTGREAWLSVACDIVESDPKKVIPDVLVDRANLSEGGVISLAKNQLKKGFSYCWPTS